MTGFEVQLTEALRAQAEGAAMSTSTPEQYETLSRRLDEVDDRRRRSRWAIGATAAAAAAVVVGIALLLGQGGPTGAPAVPPAASDAAAPELRITGHWSTLLTDGEVTRALQGTAAEPELARVLADLAEVSGPASGAGPWRLDLWADGLTGTLYVTGADGLPERLDQFTYEVVGDELAATTAGGPGSTDSARFGLVGDGDTLTLVWRSGAATGQGEVYEGIKRALYTASAWERVS